jgi:hypothetical protein
VIPWSSYCLGYPQRFTLAVHKQQYRQDTQNDVSSSIAPACIIVHLAAPTRARCWGCLATLPRSPTTLLVRVPRVDMPAEAAGCEGRCKRPAASQSEGRARALCELRLRVLPQACLRWRPERSKSVVYLCFMLK